MPTIKDVARLAGVSTATVSRVLNEEPYVTEATRAAVQRAVRQLGYSTNALARHLRTRSSKTVLVVVPNITAFFAGVLQGIEDELGLDYYVLLGNTKNDRRREQSFLDLLLARGADGAILTTVRSDTNQLTDLSRKIPLVLACQYVDGLSLPTVSIDNTAAAMDAVRYLTKLGHRRIAHIAGPLDIVVSRDRVRGYKLALQAAELPVDDRLIMEGDFSYNAGYRQTMRLLDLPSPPTAIFASSDEMAAGAIRAAQHRGIAVPAQLSVVGFDDTQIASTWDLPITTIAQPVEEIGRIAVRMLLRKDGYRDTASRIKVGHQLVVRDSSGVVPGNGKEG